MKNINFNVYWKLDALTMTS